MYISIPIIFLLGKLSIPVLLLISKVSKLENLVVKNFKIEKLEKFLLGL
ncbi:MAG: hypothetical protein CM15mP58_07570 [Burkholderiaceae bacterium]|nr:MAG: hypothetical protein CM15mP58_07570 [Burkholderiaceae bacterium]